MKSLDEKIIHAVLWVTVICFNFNARTRKSEVHVQNIKNTFETCYIDLSQKKSVRRGAWALRMLKNLILYLIETPFKN